ncbi:hypothetical protein A0O28_0023620 [Trichoderma guizhouense]|uniref:NACHT-NTPase and P-loop NTPases N-terminal domain-containing protein n=1 Tax=Trichoderma guizhouense TaxID=1491466 RepID=A0A1T3CSI0_9HYPO|nr:hypothetical protein A0O28_0023620 [Trichoderma guizhouense]
MTLSSHAIRAQATKSLSIAAYVLERTAENWCTIQKIVGLPKALYVVGETLPLLPILLKSLESSIKNNEETKDLKESLPAAFQFAELSQQQAKYFNAIFDAILTTDNHNTKEQKYRIAAEKWGGKPIEAVLKDLLQQATSLATELVTDEDLKSWLEECYDKVAKLNSFLVEDSKGFVIINNYGFGSQFYHHGQANQNQCSEGIIFGPDSNSQWRCNDGGIPAERYHPRLEERISTPITSIKSLRDRYTVGIVCALPKELMAVRILFDNKAGCYENDVWREIPDKDDNCYVFGRMGDHDVVALCLPSGAYGTNSAASAVSSMNRTFDNIAFYLLVGIGGGVPSNKNDIRLGDVVVSTPTGEYPGVVQHDFEKVTQHGEYERLGSLQRPPNFLLSAVSIVQSDPDLSLSYLLKDIAMIGERQQAYRYPGVSHDKLFAAEVTHASGYDTCSKCEGPTVERKDRRIIDSSSGEYQVPKIHYGNIASGNQVIKNAQKRDEIGRKCKVLCIEMEAAGIMNTVPCLVIRGICDYADSHKNDEWQEYAAATAAAYAKSLLSVVRGRKVR